VSGKPTKRRHQVIWADKSGCRLTAAQDAAKTTLSKAVGEATAHRVAAAEAWRNNPGTRDSAAALKGAVDARSNLVAKTMNRGPAPSPRRERPTQRQAPWMPNATQVNPDQGRDPRHPRHGHRPPRASATIAVMGLSHDQEV